MVICGARQVREGDVIYVGVGLPTLATYQAKLSHAPSCTVIHEVGIVRTRSCRLGLFLDSLPTQNMSDMMSGVLYVNSLAANYQNPEHRWHGSGGGNDVASLCPNVIIMLRQSKRRFLEKVDFITSPGYIDGRLGQREEIGLPSGTGPTVVITDMGVYHFENGEMVLKSVHTDLGITVEDVKREISWDIKIASDLKATDPPNEDELRTLREKVDPQKIFVGGKFAIRNSKFNRQR